MILDPDRERSEFVSMEPHAGQGGIPGGPEHIPDLETPDYGDGRRVPVGTDPAEGGLLMIADRPV